MANEAKTPSGGETLEGGSYEVIRGRLLTHAKELGTKAGALNERRRAEFGGDHVFYGFHERCRAAGIKNRALQIHHMLLDPCRVNASAPARPGIVRLQPRAGHVKRHIYVRILQLQKLVFEDDVLGRADAV